jgi:ribosomal-protein-serine acetyltransferase
MNPILLDIPSEFATSRLTLRVPRAGDGAIHHPIAWKSRAEIQRWMHWARDDYAQQDSEEWCRKAAANFISRQVLHYLIFLKSGSEYLGTVSAERWNWEIPRYEIGYWLRTSHNGQGFMTEAVGGLIQMLKPILHPCRVEIRCDSLNQKSARVAERLEFVLEGVLRANERQKDGTLRDTCVYALVDRSDQELPS